MNIGTFQRSRLLLMAGSAIVVAVGVFSVVAIYRDPHWLKSPNRVLAGEFFSTADSWTTLGGSWTADTSGIENTSPERGAKLVARDETWKNLQIDADVQIAEPFAEAGFILRSSGAEEGVDAYHGYFAGIRTMDSSIELGRADFGWRTLAHARIQTEAGFHGWYHLHVVAVDCTLGMQVTVPQRESSAFVLKDTDCIRSGSFGLRSSFSSSKWKNLSVRAANQADIAALEQDAGHTAIAYDPLLPEPSSPLYADNYAASAREVATKHDAEPHVTPISFFRLSPGPHPDVTIQGTIISLPPFTDIQDSTSSIYVPDVDRHIPIKLETLLRLAARWSQRTSAAF